MSITDDLNTINENYEQAEIALKYRRIFKDVYNRLKDLDIEITEISGSTKFDAIPTSVKQAMNQYWQEVKSFNTAIESNPGVIELLNWGNE